eukprot:m.89464 g.89464  ORF g.89464 m.89464 type:complete len:126 (+) comp8533_c0_seq3:426-803(+)
MWRNFVVCLLTACIQWFASSNPPARTCDRARMRAPLPMTKTNFNSISETVRGTSSPAHVRSRPFFPPCQNSMQHKPLAHRGHEPKEISELTLSSITQRAGDGSDWLARTAVHEDAGPGQRLCDRR